MTPTMTPAIIPTGVPVPSLLPFDAIGVGTTVASSTREVLVDPDASTLVTSTPVLVRPSVPTLVANNRVVVNVPPLARKEEREAAAEEAAAGPEKTTVWPEASVEVIVPPAERIDASREKEAMEAAAAVPVGAVVTTN